MRPFAAVAAVTLLACGPQQPERHAAVTRDVTQGLIDVPGARLYYLMEGRGDPIVVVHGGPGMDHTYLLPAMNGLELASLVRSRWPHISVVITSGHLEPGNGMLPQEAVFIAKPYSEQAPAMAIRALLD